ncbi:MAG TPA: SDR family oxidoreductase [Acidimicrobiales bacterium]|nr:SDR family oxidoreductase [Acidimicrobiales bacterium]
MTNTAIVTGGSKGFGRAVAAELVRRAWTVLIDGRDADAVRTAARATGAVGVPGDVTDAEHRAHLVDEAVRRGSLRLVVNNASSLGTTPLPGLANYPLDALRDVLETNVVAPLALVQATLAHLRANRGAVVNVTSDAAVEGYGGWGGYGASKAALEQWSRVLSVEEPDVAVWWVDPGDMRTEMHQAAFVGEDISDRPLPAQVAPSLIALLDLWPPGGRIVLADVAHAAGAAGLEDVGKGGGR